MILNVSINFVGMFYRTGNGRANETRITEEDVLRNLSRLKSEAGHRPEGFATFRIRTTGVKFTVWL